MDDFVHAANPESHSQSRNPMTADEESFQMLFNIESESFPKVRKEIVDRHDSPEYGRTHLLGLPGELRDMIYEYLLMDNSIKNPPKISREYEDADRARADTSLPDVRFESTQLPMPCNPLSLVCKQMESETDSWYWNLTPVWIDSSDVDDAFEENDYEKAVQILAQQPVQKCKKIVLYIDDTGYFNVQDAQSIFLRFNSWVNRFEQDERCNQELAGLINLSWNGNRPMHFEYFYKIGRAMEQALQIFPPTRKWKVFTCQHDASLDHYLEQLPDQPPDQLPGQPPEDISEKTMVRQLQKWRDQAWM